MFRAVRLCALASVALAVLATVPVTAQTEGSTDNLTASPDLPTLPLIEIPLFLGTTRAAFGVYEGETIDASGEAFGQTHGLTPADLAVVKAEVTRRLVAVADSVNQNRQHANPDENSARPLFEVPVGLETGEVVPLRLYEGDDLQAAISKFAKTQNIPNEFVPHLFEEVKKRVSEKNDDDEKQPVFDFPVTFDGETEHRVVLRPGDVVQDVVARMSASLALSEEVAATFLTQVVQRVKAAGKAADAADEKNRKDAGQTPVYTYVLRVSQIQAHCLKPLVECTTCNTTSNATSTTSVTSDTTRNIYQHWQLLQTYTRDGRD